MRTENKAILFLIFFLYILSFSLAFAVEGEDPTVEYTVIKKDCLIKIGERILEIPQKWREVARANRLKDPYIIKPNQRLIIPVRLLRGSPMDGIVTFLKGEVKIQKFQGGEWNRLKLGEEIKQGNSIKTEANSALEITFEDKSTLFLRPNTLLTITTFQKKGIFAIVNSINLMSGKALSSIKGITGTELRYEIKTPSAIASARGTDFRVSVDETLTTRAEVLDGKIMVNATGKTIEVKGGEGTVVEKGAFPIAPVRLLAPPVLRDLRPLYKDIPLVFSFFPPKEQNPFGQH